MLGSSSRCIQMHHCIRLPPSGAITKQYERIETHSSRGPRLFAAPILFRDFSNFHIPTRRTQLQRNSNYLHPSEKTLLQSAREFASGYLQASSTFKQRSRIFPPPPPPPPLLPPLASGFPRDAGRSGLCTDFINHLALHREHRTTH